MHGDKSALSPGGVRIGTAALTTRGLCPQDMQHLAALLHRAACIALDIQAACGSKLLKDFCAAAEGNQAIAQLGEDVIAFASCFPMPGA